MIYAPFRITARIPKVLRVYCLEFGVTNDNLKPHENGLMLYKTQFSQQGCYNPTMLVDVIVSLSITAQ